MMRDYFHEQSPTRFLFPIDGDCLNERDGKLTSAGLTVTVKVASTPHAQVTVNGIRTKEKNGVYSAEILLKDTKTALIAQNANDGTSDTVSAFFLPRSVGKFRISSDDNILFLADITKNKNV